MNKGYVDLIATALCWSFIGVFIRFNQQSALLINSITSIIGLCFCLILTRPQMICHPIVFFAAIAQFITGLTFVYANQLTSVGNAIALQYTSMIFVLIYQSIDQQRLPKLKHCFIIVMAIIGMVLFFFDELSVEGMIGNVLAITSGAFFGLQFYLNTKPSASPISSTIIAYALSSVLLLLMLPELAFIKPMEWGVMAISGILCSGIAGLLFARGIKSVHPLTANVICMSEAVMAPLWTFLLFHETLHPLSILGAVILLGAVLLNMIFDASDHHITAKGKETM